MSKPSVTIVFIPAKCSNPDCPTRTRNYNILATVRDDVICLDDDLTCEECETGELQMLAAPFLAGADHD